MAADPMTADEECEPSPTPALSLCGSHWISCGKSWARMLLGFVTPMSAAFFVSCCVYDELVHFWNHTTASIQALLPI